MVQARTVAGLTLDILVPRIPRRSVTHAFVCHCVAVGPYGVATFAEVLSPSARLERTPSVRMGGLLPVGMLPYVAVSTHGKLFV